MSRRYACTWSEAAGNPQTIGNLFNTGTTVRGYIYDIVLGFSLAADNQIKITAQRSSAVGTEGSGVTPAPLDGLDSAAAFDSGQAYSGGEPTYTAAKELVEFRMNQRSTQRWVASPNSELVLPATANNGAGVFTTTGATTDCDMTVLFFE